MLESYTLVLSNILSEIFFTFLLRKDLIHIPQAPSFEIFSPAPFIVFLLKQMDVDEIIDLPEDIHIDAAPLPVPARDKASIAGIFPADFLIKL